MTPISHRMVMFKPMSPGVSGYARLQTEAGRMLLHICARGLSSASAQAYWYGGGGEARLLGAARVNPHGEAAIAAELPLDGFAPERLQAILILSGGDAPAPLLIGLCVKQSAGSLLDAKNAAMALCEKLSRAARQAARTPMPAHETSAEDAHEARLHTQPDAAERAPKPRFPCPQPQKPIAPPSPPEPPALEPPAPKVRALGQLKRAGRPEVPREIFLPAIDPLPYVAALPPREEAASPQAGASEPPAPDPAAPMPPPRKAPPADRLRPLVWPEGFAQVEGWFARALPCRLFDLPGWRFIRAEEAGGPEGLWVGVQAQDGRVRRVAYAHRGDAPPPGKPYRPVRGLDGTLYQVLWQRV